MGSAGSGDVMPRVQFGGRGGTTAAVLQSAFQQQLGRSDVRADHPPWNDLSTGGRGSFGKGSPVAATYGGGFNKGGGGGGGVAAYAPSEEGGGNAGQRDMTKFDTVKYDVVGVRTQHVTEQFVRDLDDQNVRRLKMLPPDWQAHVVLTYGPSKEGKPVREPQKHFGGVIGGVRLLMAKGMTFEERDRLQRIALSGRRISYGECDEYRQTGQCRYGNQCTHPHIFH